MVDRPVIGSHPARSRWRWIASLVAALLLAAVPASLAATPEPEDAWPSLAKEIFKDRPLVDGTGLVGIEMPVRAEDAAVVPVTLRVTLPTGDTRRLKALTLVIDENPV